MSKFAYKFVYFINSSNMAAVCEVVISSDNAMGAYYARNRADCSFRAGVDAGQFNSRRSKGGQYHLI